MAQVDFPNNPSLNQTFVSGNQTWVWDGVKWVVGGSPTAGSPYLPTAGGTMTGPLIAQAAGSKLDGVTIGSVTPGPATFISLNGGPLSGLRNRILNGAFRVDQRNLLTQGAYVVGNGYCIDRWAYSSSQSNKFSLQVTSGNTGALGNAGWLSSIVSTSYAPVAADYFAVQQIIEGLNIFDLGWGFSGAKPVTLSFLFFSSIAGTHSGSISNKSIARSYVFTWNYPTPSVWQYVQVTIPGDTAGTWAIDNTQGMYLRFNLGCGSTYLGPAGAWSGTNYIGATGSVQVVAGAVNSSFVIGNVQLEAGPVATPFEVRPIGMELELCKRYYQRFTSSSASGFSFIGYTGASQYFQTPMPLSPSMRITPTGSIIGTWTGANVASFAINPTMPNLILPTMQASAAGYLYWQSPANGGFDMSAEL